VSPDGGLIVAGVMRAGYFGSTDDGKTWAKLGADDKEQIENLCTDILFDPKDSKTFWTSGAYERSIFKTSDGGKTLLPFSPLWHMDNIAVDFSDPQRQTMLAAMHETPNRFYRSSDGGKSWWNLAKPEADREGFPPMLGICDPVILDAKTYIIGCNPSWLGARGYKPAIVITDDAGQTWTKVSEQGPTGHPLVTADGVIYWQADRALLKSADRGKTWQSLDAVAITPVELPGGKLLSAKNTQLYVSADGGSTWTAFAAACPASIRYIAYSAKTKSVFIIGRSGNDRTRVFRLIAHEQ
jgi:photosystem II stability/assembly factor-like uncharacterized protein